jgi:YbbR domain-containing protein
VLDTIVQINTEHKQLENITQTLVTTIPLKKHHSQLQYSEKKVKITIPVEQFTEGEVKKELVVKNLPDSIVLRTFPRTIHITYLVGLSNYENVIPELFKVTVDYNDIEKDSERIPVKVEKAPDYLKSYSYSPHKVDYIIEKKND